MGRIFGKLTVVSFDGSRYSYGVSRKFWKCLCECGNEKSIPVNSLTSGNTKSCGCGEGFRTHGMHNTRVNQTWRDMKDRCNNPKNEYYNIYGGRCISYDLKWEKFEGFWEDMKEGYSDNLTLDRLDNDGNYCKDNCRWVTHAKQQRNKRISSRNSTGVTGVREWVDKKNNSRYYAGYYKDGLKIIEKHYSQNKYGITSAFELAKKFRSEGIKMLNEKGAGYTEDHGKNKGVL